jgi:hypothetical protein
LLITPQKVLQTKNRSAYILWSSGGKRKVKVETSINSIVTIRLTQLDNDAFSAHLPLLEMVPRSSMQTQAGLFLFGLTEATLSTSETIPFTVQVPGTKARGWHCLLSLVPSQNNGDRAQWAARSRSIRLACLGGAYTWRCKNAVSSVTGFDDKPKKVISGYSVGAFDDSTNGLIAIVDSKGKNIGFLLKFGHLESQLVGGISIYGEPGPITYTVCDQKK